MAEKVDEIAALLERLKIENDLNTSEFNSILLDMKTKLENMDFDNSQINSLINDINDTVNSKISKDEEKFIDIETTLRHLQNLVENANDTEKYSNLHNEIEALSDNFKEAVESIVKFANQDTDAKNVLFEKVSSLETAVKNKEVIEVVKQKSEDLINSFEHYTADSNLRHGNVISAIADLRHIIDDYSAKNTYLINTLDNTISANTQQLSNLDGTVSAQLGTVNSKLFSLGDDIHKTLDDGFEHLKYLSTNLSEYMNGNSIDMKTSLECLRANLSDYSEQLKKHLDDFTGAFFQAGVSELTMACMCIGMYLHGGVIPACGTFFVFSDYMKPAVRMAALMEVPIKFIWTHDAFRVGEDGPTHEPVEQEAQIRLMEKLKNHHGKDSVRVFRPADADETTVCWAMAMENTETPTALIFSRQNIAKLPEGNDYEGARRGAYVVAGSDSDYDIILLANGSEVSTLVAGAELLRKDGVKVRIVSAPSEGLFRSQSREYQESVLPTGAKVFGMTAGLPVTLEGLVGANGRVFGMPSFGFSAPYKVLDEKLGYTAENVYKQVKDFLSE